MILILDKTKKKYNLKICPEVLTSNKKDKISLNGEVICELNAPESVTVVASSSVSIHDKNDYTEAPEGPFVLQTLTRTMTEKVRNILSILQSNI